MSKKIPQQKPGKSKQDYGTPKTLLDVVKARLCIPEFDWDLAADINNTVVPSTEVIDSNGNHLITKRHFGVDEDALIQDWNLGSGWNWLNPPFADIGPWLAKAIAESRKGTQTVVLVPASVGSQWWKAYVEHYA